MHPAVAELKREGYSIQTINLENQPDMAMKYKVFAIPTFVYKLEGEEIRRKTGATTKAQLKRMYRDPSSLF